VIPQSDEFADIKSIFIGRCAPTPLRPWQLPYLPTTRPGSVFKLNYDGCRQ
jgi:hypothetical protein